MHVVALALLLAAVDGKAIFQGKGGCVGCHSVEGRGGSVGPDLGDIGIRRSPESLRLAIVDPSAEIFAEYFTVVAVTKAGERIEGVALNEDDLSIQLRDAAGNPRSLLKENLNEARREVRSLMPSYRSKLTGAEIDELVAYLRTLKGEPVAPRPRTRQIAPLTEAVAWLTRPERDADERPELLLDELRIRRGATVVDLGAGAGYFTWRLAQRVGPQGKVIAVDVQQAMLDRTAEELKKQKLGGVELVLGAARDPKLPAGAVDLVLIANAYHEFSDPESMMAAVRRSLKPGGRLVVVEYEKEDAQIPVSELHRMSFEEIRSEIEPMGFELERVLDLLPMQHCLIFSKRN